MIRFIHSLQQLISKSKCSNLLLLLGNLHLMHTYLSNQRKKKKQPSDISCYRMTFDILIKYYEYDYSITYYFGNWVNELSSVQIKIATRKDIYMYLRKAKMTEVIQDYRPKSIFVCRADHMVAYSNFLKFEKG